MLALALTIINIAGLVLSRGLRRTPEFALRGALGGGGRAIAGQLAVEAALIAVPGCALGLWLAMQTVGAIGPWVPSDLLIRGRHIVVDYRAAAVCVAVIAITMAGLALAPLGVARRAAAAAALTGAWRSGGLPSAGRTRERLLIAQMALTVVLLAVGALFVKSFAAESRIPLGFDPADGWSLHVSLSDARYRDSGLVRQYADALIERTRTIPGVRNAAVATSSPLLSGWLVLSSGLLCAYGAAVWIGDALYLVPGNHNGLLYDTRTTDPIALGGAAMCVILIALGSGAIPARRLARIDPVKTLRAE